MELRDLLRGMTKAERDAFTEMTLKLWLPSQIRDLRIARGWTQQELAERAGLTQVTISKLETSTQGYPTMQTLKRIASALDVALVARFASFSEIAREGEPSPVVPSFNDEQLEG